MWIVKNVDKHVLKQWWSELTGEIHFSKIYFLILPSKLLTAERLHFLCEVLKIILSIFQYKVSKTHNSPIFLELTFSFIILLPPRDPMLGKTRIKSDKHLDYLNSNFSRQILSDPLAWGHSQHPSQYLSIRDSLLLNS